MMVVPLPAVLANPPAVMVATLTSEDDQVTCAVRSSVVPSLKLPIAVNCCVAATGQPTQAHDKLQAAISLGLNAEDARVAREALAKAGP